MSTAIARPNIALIKYWGKAQEELIIPATGSLSLTLNVFPTTTSVHLIDAADDEALLGGVPLAGSELARVTLLLDLMRRRAGRTERARVVSTNTVPTAAGLASSAAAFAALAVAAADAYGLALSEAELSRIARRGSGSAARSLCSGLALWNAGDDDHSSFAQSLPWHGDELAMVLCIVTTDRKAVSSREAMRTTARTSPFYSGWVTANAGLLEEAIGAVERSDYSLLGELTELSTFRMHASMLGARPPIRYLTASSFTLFDAVAALRNDGLECYATADAGPNVKVLCRATEATSVAGALSEALPGVTTIIAGAGEGARLDHEDAA